MVTVLMPVYNASKFLKEAIDSILNQTFGDFEFLIINDGSTDNSELIIKGYTDNRIKYHYQSNQGVAVTLNNGLKLATRKYIWRHDADDISLPNKLEEEVRFLEANPEISLCACQVAFMTETGKIAWGYRQPGSEYFQDQPFKNVERNQFNPYSPITHGTVLIKTEVMHALKGYRNEFITSEDVDLWLRFLTEYKGVVLNQCLSLHRLSNASATKLHGWKNEFFRNQAFEYYEQRVENGSDDLQKGISIVLPEAPEKIENVKPKGSILRNDLLSYQLPLHLNAKDYRGSLNIIGYALQDGWKLSATWKLILFALIGKNLVQKGVVIKRMLK